jgi:hypothetical protein
VAHAILASRHKICFHNEKGKNKTYKKEKNEEEKLKIRLISTF